MSSDNKPTEKEQKLIEEIKKKAQTVETNEKHIKNQDDYIKKLESEKEENRKKLDEINSKLPDSKILEEQTKDLEEIIAKQESEIKKLQNAPQASIPLPGIHITETYKGNFKNGFRDGTYKKLMVDRRNQLRNNMRDDKGGNYIPEELRAKNQQPR